MKLRNKKTGEIAEVSKIGLVWNKYGMPADIGQYNSLSELNEEWEDYKPNLIDITNDDELMDRVIKSLTLSYDICKFLVNNLNLEDNDETKK